MRICRTAAFLLCAILVQTPTVLVGATIAQDPPPPPAAVPTQIDTTTVNPADGTVAVYGDEVAAGPLVPGARITFTRDSIVWSSALTVSDLLSAVPGVYVARGGFLGQPEYIMYGGRGPAGVEFFWDGMPLHPLGGDSVYVDSGRMPLSYLSRVDVEVLPSGLRVYLVTNRVDRAESRSMLRVMSGAFSTAEYAGVFQKRWANGFGLNVAADFTGSDGAPAQNRSDNLFDIWVKLQWHSTPRTGASYQIRRQDMDRDFPVAEGGAPARSGKRTDISFRMFHALREDRRGVSFDLGVGSSSWTDDSLVADQRISQAFGTIRFRQPYINAEVTGRIGDGRVERAVEGRIGWTPIAPLVFSANGYLRDHGLDRVSRLGGVSGGLILGPIAIVGEIAHRDGIQAAVFPDDSAQQTDDMGARVHLATRWLTGSVGVVKRDAFLPLVTPDFPTLVVFDSTPSATFLVADVQFRPLDPLTVRAWYSDSRTDPGALQPPQHGRVEFVFRSKFFRQFRSGVYDFKLGYGVEYWSRGVAGIVDDAPVELPGATFHEIFAQIRLVDFKVFWNLRNSRNSRAVYVPGLTYPRNAQTFGVKWEFIN